MTQYTSLKEKAYHIIKEKIVTNEFEPNQHLNEKDLCNMLDISRTPLREAINKLELEGLVQMIPRKGIFVSDLSIELAKELFQARRLFEPVVLKQSYQYLEEDKLIDIKERSLKAYEEKNYAALDDLDYEFHNYITYKCNNQYITKMMKGLSDQFHRVRTRSFYKEERTKGGAIEHVEIIDLLIEDELYKAIDLLKTHISNTEKYFFRSLTQTQKS